MPSTPIQEDGPVIPHDRIIALVPGGIIAFMAGYAFIRFGEFGYPLISAVFIVILAIPSFWALLNWVGAARAAGVIVLLGILAIAVEAAAILTGFPYGSFHYAEHIGVRILGLVPWTVAFAYLPMLFGAIALASQIVGTQPLRLIGGGALFVMLVDLVIDPAAVQAGLWVWKAPGSYYGVPLINFAGWAISGSIYTAIFLILTRKWLLFEERLPINLAFSLHIILALWSGYLLKEMLFVPALLGIGLMALILACTHREDRAPRYQGV
jgi:putative membrane protein